MRRRCTHSTHTVAANSKHLAAEEIIIESNFLVRNTLLLFHFLLFNRNFRFYVATATVDDDENHETEPTNGQSENRWFIVLSFLLSFTSLQYLNRLSREYRITIEIWICLRVAVCCQLPMIYSAIWSNFLVYSRHSDYAKKYIKQREYPTFFPSVFYVRPQRHISIDTFVLHCRCCSFCFHIVVRSFDCCLASSSLTIAAHTQSLSVCECVCVWNYTEYTRIHSHMHRSGACSIDSGRCWCKWTRRTCERTHSKNCMCKQERL